MQLFSEDYLISRGVEPNYLMHYGVSGMKWGVRKARGLGYRTMAKVYGVNERYYSGGRKPGGRNSTMAAMNRQAKNRMLKKASAADPAYAAKKAQKQAKLDAMTPEQRRSYIRKQRLKRAAIGVGVAAGVAGAAYGAHKLNQRHKAVMKSRRDSQEQAMSLLSNAMRDHYNGNSGIKNAQYYMKDNKGRTVRLTYKPGSIPQDMRARPYSMSSSHRTDRQIIDLAMRNNAKRRSGIDTHRLGFDGEFAYEVIGKKKKKISDVRR